jgi:hypothetical protein
VKNIFVLSAFFWVAFSNANAQIFAERANQEQAFHKIYIYEKHPTESVIIDSIELLNIFSELSYFLSDSSQILYVVYSSIGTDPKTYFQGKTYFIDEYALDENKKILRSGQYWIEEDKHKSLFNKGLRVAVIDKGLQLSFTHGKFSLLVFSFDELNLKDISRELSKIDKL